MFIIDFQLISVNSMFELGDVLSKPQPLKPEIKSGEIPTVACLLPYILLPEGLDVPSYNFSHFTELKRTRFALEAT